MTEGCYALKEDKTCGMGVWQEVVLFLNALTTEIN